MENKRLKKKIKNIIKAKGVSIWIYKLDKFLRIRKIKINNIKLEEETPKGKVYRVNYKHDFNKLNPISWLIILCLIMYRMFELLKEIIKELRNGGEYTGTFIVKD